jgi:predicted aspartyl protease
VRYVLLERKGVSMGRISVEIELANHADVILARNHRIPEESVRRARIPGVVDTGATDLVLPASVVASLGFPEIEQVVVLYADNRQGLRTEVGEVELKLLGRSKVFSAIVEPDRVDALVGAIVLESLDLITDCKDQRVLPRDPRGLTAAIGVTKREAIAVCSR